MVDDNDRFPSVSKIIEHLDDRALSRRVDALEWLVEDVDWSVLDKGTGQQHPLLLAARERCDGAPGEVGHPDLLEGSHCLFFFSGSTAAEPAHPAISPHCDDIDDIGRKIPRQRRSLRDVGDLSFRALTWFAKDPNLTCNRFDQTHRRLDQGALAGAIGAYDRHLDTLRDLQIDVPQHRFVGVGDGQILDLERPVFSFVHTYPPNRLQPPTRARSRSSRHFREPFRDMWPPRYLGFRVSRSRGCRRFRPQIPVL